MMSSSPSPFTSPRITDAGLEPVATVACAANDGKAVIVGEFTRFKPRVPAPVMPVTLTVRVAPEPVIEEMVPPATVPVVVKVKSAASTPVTD